jgi:hypothetical protein
LISGAQQVLGNIQQEIWHKEIAFLAAPTMMGMVHDVLGSYIKGNDVLKMSKKKAASSDALSRRQKKTLKAAREAEIASYAGQHKDIHPAIDLVERTIVPALQISAAQGASPRTLAKSYWVVAFDLFTLAEMHPNPNDGGLGAAVTALIRRLLHVAAELDGEDIRFSRSLAVSYGKTSEFEAMNRALVDVLTLNPKDPEAVQMAEYLLSVQFLDKNPSNYRIPISATAVLMLMRMQRPGGPSRTQASRCRRNRKGRRRKRRLRRLRKVSDLHCGDRTQNTYMSPSFYRSSSSPDSAS